MRRREAVTDEETESVDSAEEEVTESDESLPASSKKEQLQFVLPNFSFSYKQLPKKCLKFSFLCINSATFVSLLDIISGLTISCSSIDSEFYHLHFKSV